MYFVSSSSIEPARVGRYGIFARVCSGGYSFYVSKKEMEARGYALQELTKTQAEATAHAIADSMRIATDSRKLIEKEKRAQQVAKCLRSSPLALSGSSVRLSGSFLDAYSGCGSGVAYILGGGLIAWHYGEYVDRPENAPQGCEAFVCELSGTVLEILSKI